MVFSRGGRWLASALGALAFGLQLPAALAAAAPASGGPTARGAPGGDPPREHAADDAARKEELGLALARQRAGAEADAEAEAALRAAVELDPLRGAAWHGLAVLASRRGDKAAALDGYRTAAALDSTSGRVHLGLGRLLAKSQGLRLNLII